MNASLWRRNELEAIWLHTNQTLYISKSTYLIWVKIWIISSILSILITPFLDRLEPCQPEPLHSRVRSWVMVAAQKIQQGLQAVWNMQSQQCCCQAVRHVLQNTWSCKVLLQLQQHCCKSGIKALLQSRPKSTVAKHMQLQSIAEPIQVTSFLNSWIFHMTCYVIKTMTVAIYLVLIGASSGSCPCCSETLLGPEQTWVMTNRLQNICDCKSLLQSSYNSTAAKQLEVCSRAQTCTCKNN